MRMSAPKKVTWWISLILIALAVIASFVSIPVLSGIAFWLAVVGGVILLIANITKGM